MAIKRRCWHRAFYYMRNNY